MFSVAAVTERAAFVRHGRSTVHRSVAGRFCSGLQRLPSGVRSLRGTFNSMYVFWRVYALYIHCPPWRFAQGANFVQNVPGEAVGAVELPRWADSVKPSGHRILWYPDLGESFRSTLPSPFFLLGPVR